MSAKLLFEESHFSFDIFEMIYISVGKPLFFPVITKFLDKNLSTILMSILQKKAIFSIWLFYFAFSILLFYLF